MKAHLVGLVVATLLAVVAFAQEQPIKIALTASSNLPSADIVKNMAKPCPNVTVTLDGSKANFMLEASGEGSEAGEYARYKLTLFDRDGSAIFSTSTRHVSSAVKDVCTYLKRGK